MTQELDKKLVDKYPLIFADRYKDDTESAMCYGFSHGDGWYWLLDTLCDHIQRYLDNNKHLHIEQVVASQVKEKFGTLCFYYDGGNEYIRGIVSHAEFLSGSICEMCGTTNNIGMTQGWLTTICYEDWLKYSNRNTWTDANTGTSYGKDENGLIIGEYTNEK